MGKVVGTVLGAVVGTVAGAGAAVVVARSQDATAPTVTIPRISVNHRLLWFMAPSF
jgi:outer membrane lipoprotein SlyB